MNRSLAKVASFFMTLAWASIGFSDTADFFRRLVPDDPSGGGMSFGCSVDLDNACAIVGACNDTYVQGDTRYWRAGSAYLFDTDTGSIIGKLIPPDAAREKQFGNSVAISDTAAIVGAWRDGAEDFRPGSAYLYNAQTGQLRFKLLPPILADDLLFGASVDISDGIAIVGSPGDSANGPYAGAVFLYDVQSGKLISRLIAPDGVPSAGFGNSVAISGGLAVVGAHRDGEHLPASGSAYVFDVKSGELRYRLEAPDLSANRLFGFAVAIDGATIAVSTYIASPSGSVYLFDAETGELLRSIRSPADPENGRDRFGFSLDLDANTLVVGAPHDHETDGFAGASYVFALDSGLLDSKLLARDGGRNHYFGRSIALDGAVALIGAPEGSAYEVKNGYLAGASYLFEALACIGDLNGDGLVDSADLGGLVGVFGTDGPDADLNRDGIVDAADLGLLIGAFGTTCP